MAQLISPQVNWGTSTRPTTMSELVSPAQIMVGGPPAIYTGGIMASPISSQLAAEPAVGYVTSG